MVGAGSATRERLAPAEGGTTGRGAGAAGAMVLGTLLPRVSPGASPEGPEQPATTQAAAPSTANLTRVDWQRRSMQGTIDFLGELA